MHYLVASYLGYKPPVQTSAQPITDIDELLPSLGNVPIRQVPALDTAAFDAAQKEPHG